MHTNLAKLIIVAALIVPAVASAQVGTVTATVRANVETHAATSTALVRETQTIANQAAQVQSTANAVAALGANLQMRLASSTATSSDIAAANAALADLNAKVADAQVQASAALGHIASATGPSSTKANTNAELKKAHADIVVAKQDLAAARKDIDKVMKVLGVRKPEAGVNATSSAQIKNR